MTIPRLASPCSIVASAVAAVLSVNSGSAFGASFALLEQSSSRLGTAFAGTGAAADDATTLFYNPAGVTRLESAEATAVGSAIYIDSSFENADSQSAFGQPLGVAGGNAGGLNGVPSLYLAMPLSESFYGGFAFNVPFGLALDYDSDWMGRFQALRSEIQTYNFNPALAWEVNEHFSVGIGINYQRAQAELTNSVNYTAVVAQGVQQLVAAGQISAAQVPGLIAANTGLEGRTQLRGDDSAWGYNIGLLFTASTGTRIGLSYRSSMDYELEGSVQFAPAPASNPIGTAIIASASAPGAALASGRATVDLKLPDSATVSVYQPITANLSLLADAAWTGWSSIQELRVLRDTREVIAVTPEDWDDTWRFALGASYALRSGFTLRAGVAMDSTPVPASTLTARLPDSDRTWVAIGIRWQANDAVVFDAGYAHLFSDEARVEQDADNAALNGLISGQQTSAVDILSLQIGYHF